MKHLNGWIGCKVQIVSKKSPFSMPSILAKKLFMFEKGITLLTATQLSTDKFSYLSMMAAHITSANVKRQNLASLQKLMMSKGIKTCQHLVR